jgi:hypothetical protein
MRLVSIAIACITISLAAQPPAANYDEAKVPAYKLPDPLILANGHPVKDAATWMKQRRPELVRLFEENIYGRSPGKPATMTWELTSLDRNALEGKAVRKQVTIYFQGKSGPKMDMLIYLPRAAVKPVPLFLSLNFGGNHTVSKDPGIKLPTSWVAGKPPAVVDHHATAEGRGSAESRWPVEAVLQRGYGVATIYYGDIEPDHEGGFSAGVRPLFLKPGENRPEPDAWGAIAAWGWGMSRAMDYLETDKDVDPRRVAIAGHSRLGKATLWAGARDTRFAVVISNDSGEGGAALSRRKFGEQIVNLNDRFPWWFCTNYSKYNDNEDALPVDMHELVALIAPRPVYIASAQEDLWSDPHGEFLSAKAASPVYRLLGAGGLDVDQMPGIHQPVTSRIGYHIRAGKHDITLYDWQRFMDFTDKWMR